MADKISTIILKVDLDCRRCYKKISKTICKLQERGNIQTIIFDEKTNTVTISGPFDSKKMCKKLCYNACNVIKDIQIKDNKEKEKPKPAEPKKDIPKETKPAEPKKDVPKETKPGDKPKDAKPVEAAEPKKDKPKDAAEPKDKPKDAAEPKKNQVDPPASIPVRAEPVWQSAWVEPGCVCGCRPWHEGYYGDNRGCLCGRGGGYGGGWVPGGPLPTVVYGTPVYDGGYNKPGTFFCEEDPQASCSVM